MEITLLSNLIAPQRTDRRTGAPGMALQGWDELPFDLKGWDELPIG